MHLVIDIGNTRTKTAIFSDDNLLDFLVTDNSDPASILPLLQKYLPKKCIISSVLEDNEAYLSYLRKHTEVLLFHSKIKLPIKNNYQSLDSLGTDRIAAVVGASILKPYTNVLVINAGTCVTYDLLTSAGEYLGGAISPGLAMRFKALNTFTDKLPLVAYHSDFLELIGNTTESSILSGVQTGLIAEVEGIIKRYNEAYSPLFVIFSGGDTNFLVSRLKNSIFAPQILSDPQLVLKGLNKILTTHHA